MAHQCPECGLTCYCAGDGEDLCEHYRSLECFGALKRYEDEEG